MKLPMSTFKPGFRLSIADVVILVVGVVGGALAWPIEPLLACAVWFVVGQFFLFCNVLRMGRTLELIWAGIFIGLAAAVALFHWISWPAALAGSLLATTALAAIELRKPSYHGVGWRRINPDLPRWWGAAWAALHPEMTYLHVGGVVGLGFDEQEAHLLVVSHDGRGVFRTADWAKIARDRTPAYPENGIAIGIGPIHGASIAVAEMNDRDAIVLSSRSGRFHVHYDSGTIQVRTSGRPISPRAAG